ncbi:amidohydrolase family protein, partial [Cytophagaceae bacterium AH-315-L13]|nr:amidohydrolase family protein [Cytophagaceae bacterium AH-315-L13]
DLHMEAVAKETSLSEWFKSPPNPKLLNENIKAFERLLGHNSKAKIVWQHVGWDNTGHLTTQLLDNLLSKHANLYIGLKCLQKGQNKTENRPLSNNTLKNEWIELIKKYPNRFMLGSDFFYGIPGKTRPMPDSSKESRMIVDQLPDEVKEKVAFKNAKTVYNLD